MKCITIFPGPKGDKNTKKGIEILRGKSRKLEVGITWTAIPPSLGIYELGSSLIKGPNKHRT